MKVKWAVLLSGVLAIPAVQAATFSFEDAWHQVLATSDALEAKKAEVSRAVHLQEAKKDLYLPDISLQGSYVRNEKTALDPKKFQTDNPMLKGLLSTAQPIEVSDGKTYSSSIRAIWPVFTGGRITAAQDIAKSQTDEAGHLLEMEKQARFEDLSNIYFSVVLSEQVLHTRKEVEQGLQEHYQHAIKLEEQGQIARVERLQAQASFDKAKVERRKAERQLEISRAALSSQLKSTETLTLSSGLFTNPSLPALDDFVRQSLSSYPGLDMLKSKEKQASGLIKAEKGAYYPQVALVGNYQLAETDTLMSKAKPDWAVGVSVKLSLLDSAGRSGKVQAAYSAVEQVQFLRAQAERDLRLLVEKTYREANQSLEEYQGLASSIKLAEETVLLREKGFSQGLSTSLDVVDAELYLASIKTQRLVAAYQYVISLTRLLAVSGNMNQFTQYQEMKGLEVQL